METIPEETRNPGEETRNPGEETRNPGGETQEPDIKEPIQEVPFYVSKLPEIVIIREKSDSNSSQDELIKKEGICDELYENLKVLVEGCHECYREPACCLRIAATVFVTCAVCVGISFAFTYL